MPLSASERERLLATIDSVGWSYVLEAVREQCALWERRLVSDVHLPEDERRALVIARLALRRALAVLYEKASRSLPDFLNEEGPTDDART